MQTLYIDVYFFINFTVDMLSLFISSKLCALYVRFRRLFLLSFFFSLFACAYILFKGIILKICVSVLFFLFFTVFIARNMSILRRIKAFITFYITQALLGGIVYSMYVWIERNLSGKLLPGSLDSENRYALVISLLILFSIGVIKILLMLLPSDIKEENIKISLKIGGAYVEADALIDSGNLVCDPMNMSPVVFIKENLAERILPENIISLSNVDALPLDLQRRIRLIPLTRNGETHVIVGVRMDKVELIRNNKREEINVTVAIDNERGTFGGYFALLPLRAVKNVI